MRRTTDWMVETWLSKLCRKSQRRYHVNFTKSNVNTGENCALFHTYRNCPTHRKSTVWCKSTNALLRNISTAHSYKHFLHCKSSIRCIPLSADILCRRCPSMWRRESMSFFVARRSYFLFSQHWLSFSSCGPISVCARRHNHTRESLSAWGVRPTRGCHQTSC